MLLTLLVGVVIAAVVYYIITLIPIPESIAWLKTIVLLLLAIYFILWLVKFLQ